jgi:hypothetical protein
MGQIRLCLIIICTVRNTTLKTHHTKWGKFFAIDSSIKGLIFKLYNQPNRQPKITKRKKGMKTIN